MQYVRPREVYGYEIGGPRDMMRDEQLPMMSEWVYLRRVGENNMSRDPEGVPKSEAIRKG